MLNAMHQPGQRLLSLPFHQVSSGWGRGRWTFRRGRQNGPFDFKNQELISSSFSNFMERTEEEVRRLVCCEIVRNGLDKNKI